MSEQQKGMQVRVDAYTRVCLTVIAALLTVMIVGLWAEQAPLAGEVRAKDGIPNAGAQRQVMIKALQANTAKLEELVGLFESGKAKVQVAEAKEKAEKDHAATRKAKK